MEAVVTLSKYEAERGKPMPSRSHGRTQHRLSVALSHYDDQFTFLSELSLKLGDDEFVPDLSVFPYYEEDWGHDEAKVTEAPLLTIEILSPTQALNDLLLKAEAYFAAGVKSCWIVLPALKTIVILSPEARPQYFTEGIVHDVATGIEVKVEDIFR